MSSPDDMLMENLEEYILEENKVVTFKWLCQTLSVHCNKAKQVLKAFVDKHGKSVKLHVTHLVCGWSLDDAGNKCLKIVLADENSLEEVSSQLSPIVSKHVYSVGKGKLSNWETLYNVDHLAFRKQSADGCGRNSAIHFVPEKTSRHLRKQQGPAPSRQQKPSPVKSKNVASIAGEKKIDDCCSKKSSASASQTNKGIAAMFSNPPSVKKYERKTVLQTNSGDKDKEEISDVHEERKRAKFSLHSHPSRPKSQFDELTTSSKIPSKASAEDGSKEVDEPMEESESPVISVRRSPRKAAAEHAAERNGSHKKRKSESERMKSDKKVPLKKRKRILAEVDSEDDSGDDSEYPIPESEEVQQHCSKVVDSGSEDEEEVIPSNGASPLKEVNKQLKETYIDEDEFLVTDLTKCGKSSSAAASKVPPAKKNAFLTASNSRKQQKQAAVPAKSKQASLMTFFRKT